MSATLQKLVSAISNAVKTETLDKVFLVPTYPEQEMKISFDYGEQMDNRKYQKLVDKILQADSSNEKISLILNEVHSLADLLDILSDTEFNDEDYELLINMLPLSITCHHAATDGYHVNSFLESLQEDMNNFKRYL